MTFFNGITLRSVSGRACLHTHRLPAGNIQTAIIVSRAYYHDDVRNHGSGNAGSTIWCAYYGYGPGAITFAGDSLKALLGVLIGSSSAGRSAESRRAVRRCRPLLAVVFRRVSRR
jgi:glycerol-3-phosphate acyltransferase PlsY